MKLALNQGPVCYRHGEDSLALQTDVEGMTARIQQYPPPIGARLLGRLAGTEVERLLLCFVEIVDVQIEVVALRSRLLGPAGAV